MLNYKQLIVPPSSQRTVTARINDHEGLLWGVLVLHDKAVPKGLITVLDNENVTITVRNDEEENKIIRQNQFLGALEEAEDLQAQIVEPIVERKILANIKIHAQKKDRLSKNNESIGALKIDDLQCDMVIKTELSKLISEVTDDSSPVCQALRSVPLAEREKVKAMLHELLKYDIIRESTSPWSSPLVLVKEKDGNRLCVDYKQLNKVVKFYA